MFLTFGVLTNAALIVLGTVWCREMLGRWRRDLDELRSTTDMHARLALVVLWVITALVAALLINSLVSLLKNVGLLGWV